MGSNPTRRFFGPLEQRSARVPVTDEATGSNPVGTAMANGKFATNIMTRKGQSSRWEYRHIIKMATKKRRRAEGKKVCDAEAR